MKPDVCRNRYFKTKVKIIYTIIKFLNKLFYNCMINRKERTNNFGSFVKVNIIIMGASTTYTESQVQPETVKAIFKALKEPFESKEIRIPKHIEKSVEESMGQFNVGKLNFRIIAL